MKKYNNEIFGAICLLAAGFFLSFGGLLIRLVDDATTMQVTSYRSITFCLVALIYILIKFKSETPKAFINIGKDGLLLAVILGLSNIFFVFGMSNTYRWYENYCCNSRVDDWNLNYVFPRI